MFFMADKKVHNNQVIPAEDWEAKRRAAKHGEETETVELRDTRETKA